MVRAVKFETELTGRHAFRIRPEPKAEISTIRADLTNIDIRESLERWAEVTALSLRLLEASLQNEFLYGCGQHCHRYLDVASPEDMILLKLLSEIFLVLQVPRSFAGMSCWC